MEKLLTSWKKITFLIIIITAFVVAFWNLGVGSLKNWDEGIYALISNEMLQSHSSALQLNNTSWFEKPPLGFWIEATSIRFLGFTEFAIRFPSAIFFFFSILLLYKLAQELLEKKLPAFIATILFALSPAITTYHMGRGGDMDTGMLFFTLLSFYFFIRALKKPQWLLASGVATGLALMQRGGIAIFIPTAQLIFLILTKQIKTFSWRYYLGYCTLASVIALPWHIWQVILYGKTFTDKYFLEQLFSRVSSPLQNHSGPWYYYFSFLWQRETWTQLIILPAIIWGMIKAIKNKEKKYIFLSVWLIVFYLPLIIMQTKLYWYLLPVLPVFYIFTADIIVNALKKLKTPTKIFIVVILISLLLPVWRKTYNFVFHPAKDDIPQIAEYLRDYPKKEVVFYRNQIWYNGWIYPQSDYYFTKRNDYKTYLIEDPNNVTVDLRDKNIGYLITLKQYQNELSQLLLQQNIAIEKIVGFKDFRLFIKK